MRARPSSGKCRRVGSTVKNALSKLGEMLGTETASAIALHVVLSEMTAYKLPSRNPDS